MTCKNQKPLPKPSKLTHKLLFNCLLSEINLNISKNIGYGKWCLHPASSPHLPSPHHPSIHLLTDANGRISLRYLQASLLCSPGLINSLLSQLASASRRLSSAARNRIDPRLNRSPERFNTGRAGTQRTCVFKVRTYTLRFIMTNNAIKLLKMY